MTSSPEAPARIPWPWLMLAVGALALGRYLVDDVTETYFRVGLGLLAGGAAWIFARGILVRPSDRQVVDRTADETRPADAAERFTLPPSRFTLPPGVLDAPAEPSPGPQPHALGASATQDAGSHALPHAPPASSHVAPQPPQPHVAQVPSQDAVPHTAPLAPPAASYVAPAVPHTAELAFDDSTLVARTDEDPDATWVAKVPDVDRE